MAQLLFQQQQQLQQQVNEHNFDFSVELALQELPSDRDVRQFVRHHLLDRWRAALEHLLTMYGAHFPQDSAAQLARVALLLARVDSDIAPRQVPLFVLPRVLATTARLHAVKTNNTNSLQATTAATTTHLELIARKAGAAQGCLLLYWADASTILGVTGLPHAKVRFDVLSAPQLALQFAQSFAARYDFEEREQLQRAVAAQPTAFHVVSFALLSSTPQVFANVVLHARLNDGRIDCFVLPPLKIVASNRAHAVDVVDRACSYCAESGWSWSVDVCEQSWPPGEQPLTWQLVRMK